MSDSREQDQSPKRRILIAGATGYIGGRLLPAFENAGFKVRCKTEVIAGDVLDRTSLMPAVEGLDTAYYLVDPMGTSGDFQNEDRLAAKSFGEVAREAGVQRIIYLGGLGASSESLSSVIELRASKRLHSPLRLRT